MYLAVDIGGTKTLVALFSKRGRVLRRVKFKTSWQKERFMRELTQVLKQFSKYQLSAVVVAVPGVVQKNCSVRLGNRDWGDFSLVETVQKLFDCSIYFENDANLAAVYESHRLPGKTVFLTFSTGIGGGIATRGHILPESDSFEPGHKIYNYNGVKAEWEDIAASSALEKAFHVDAATDLRGKEYMMEIAERVYLGLSDVVSKYHPDTIVLGGPLGKIFNLYVKYLPKIEGVRYRRPRRPLESVIYGCYIFGKNQK
ncbi:ROK family protein [Candidatus Saccharibacteria bacterium]|nr:ROK family protein [Candidatus Saccharibacteria bacterium]